VIESGVIVTLPKLACTDSMDSVSIDSSVLSFVVCELASTPMEGMTVNGQLQIETVFVNANAVIVHDSSMQIDDTVIGGRTEATVGPAKPKLVPPRRMVPVPTRVTVSTMTDISYDNGDASTQSVTFPRIGRGQVDPCIGFFSQPGSHHEPLDLPLLPFARWHSGSLMPAARGDKVQCKKLRHRNRWTQTAVVRTDDVGIQAEHDARINNFGLPRGLCLSAIIRMTPCQGESIGRLVYLLECEYSQILQ